MSSLKIGKPLFFMTTCYKNIQAICGKGAPDVQIEEGKNLSQTSPMSRTEYFKGSSNSWEHAGSTPGMTFRHDLWERPCRGVIQLWK